MSSFSTLKMSLTDDYLYHVTKYLLNSYKMFYVQVSFLLFILKKYLLISVFCILSNIYDGCFLWK